MKHFTKAAAVCLSTLLAVQAMPLPCIQAADSGEVVYSNDFEDGDTSAFSNRGGDDTTEISAATEEENSSNHVLVASGRSQSWNGPAFRMDNLLKPNTEYYLSMKLRGKWYTDCTVSMQYDDATGKTHYSNLRSYQGGGWQEVENLVISFSSTMKNVFVYVEGGSEDIMLDDFVITEVPAVPIQEDIPSLRDVYNDYFKIGTAVTPTDMASKSFMALLNKHFSASITVGNELKPDSVLDMEATLAAMEESGDDTDVCVNFGAAMPVLDYCRDNNIPVRVHTLVWYSQTPMWFFKENYDESGDWVSKEKMLKRMENYIKHYFTELVKLYPTINFYACDVVNEALLEDGSPRPAIDPNKKDDRASAWVTVFGDNSFIEPAFTFAREYAPKGCKLYYNDYNEYMDKRTAIVDMAMKLKEKGVIDGIGMQSHLDVRPGQDPFPTVGHYELALKAFSETGLDIQVTELDATIERDKDTPEARKIQAKYYSDLMDKILEYSDHISAVIFWGITDDKSWRHDQYPLLFDADYQAKPAYDAIVDDIEYTTAVSTSTTSTTSTTTTTLDSTGGTGSYESLPGDLNMDKAVDIKDAVLLARLAGNDATLELSAYGRANADLDGDSAFTAEDLSILLRRIVSFVK